ncbi:MAG: hypothetical protein HWN81_06190 [Candidatus Lokiarchaeota archaeon]|nr:hypothetical protein [Candidatus Lokiarchaeota archaeon]
MSKINYISSDLKSQCTEDKKSGHNLSKKYCGNCNKEYIFENVIGEYPELFHGPITTLWKNSEIKFYCSYCYLLKIIKSIKKNKKNQS